MDVILGETASAENPDPSDSGQQGIALSLTGRNRAGPLPAVTGYYRVHRAA